MSQPGPDAGTPRTPVSARDVAAQAQGRRGRRHAARGARGRFLGDRREPHRVVSGRTSIEVAQSNPGMCAVLENAALLYASGQSQTRARAPRAGRADRPGCEELAACLACALRPAAARRRPRRVRQARAALRRAVRALAAGLGRKRQAARAQRPRRHAGGYAAADRQAHRRVGAADRGRAQADGQAGRNRRALDLSQVQGFDDAGARLLAETLAEARKQRYAAQARALRQAAQRARHPRAARPRRGRGRVAPVARAPAVREQAGGVRRPRDRVRRGFRAVAAVVGAAAGRRQSRRGGRRSLRSRPPPLAEDVPAQHGRVDGRR